MNAPSIKRSSSSPGFLLVISALLLSFAIFGWGLHYKLSLYHPAAQSAAQEPAAKLLSPQERSVPQAQELTHPEPVLVPILLFTALLALGMHPNCVLERVRLTKQHSISKPSRAQALFRRPPPRAFLHF